MEVMTRTITVTTGDDDKNEKISYSSTSINYKTYIRTVRRNIYDIYFTKICQKRILLFDNVQFRVCDICGRARERERERETEHKPRKT